METTHRIFRRAADQLESRARVRLARELADCAVAQVRDMALLLRPSMLDDLDLVPALKWQAREVARSTGIKVKVVAETVADDLPDDCRTCIYRTVQEAVNNAAQRAHASTVRVEARQQDRQIHASIEDDGAGFDPALEKGMRYSGHGRARPATERAFRIDSARGRGTKVPGCCRWAQATVREA